MNLCLDDRLSTHNEEQFANALMKNVCVVSLVLIAGDRMSNPYSYTSFLRRNKKEGPAHEKCCAEVNILMAPFM